MAAKAKKSFPEISHAKRRAFLAAFARLGTVTHAARAAKIDRKTHQTWMHLEGPHGDAYREAFDRAKVMACDELERAARRRATGETRKPIFYKGEKVATVADYSDLLLIFLLKAADPQRFDDHQRLTVEVGGGVEVQHQHHVEVRAAVEAIQDDDDIAEFLRSRAGKASGYPGDPGGNGNGRH